MMSNLSEIYDADFFKEWGPRHDEYLQSAERIVEAIHSLFQPQRLIDIGCGCGVYAHYFQQRGVAVTALDGVEPPEENRFPIPIHVQDLTVDFANSWGRFDLALCLEVAEHIPAALVEPFLINITRFSDRLILSAAPPGQGGTHHVNEQPKRYWVQKLAQHGFVYRRRETGRLVDSLYTTDLPYKWMAEHISIYERAPDPALVRGDLPFGVRMTPRGQ